VSEPFSFVDNFKSSTSHLLLSRNRRLKNQNFMSDKKRNTFFLLIFCSRAKNIRFITRAPTPPPALVIKRLFLALEKNTVKKSFFCFFFKQIGMKFIFHRCLDVPTPFEFFQFLHYISYTSPRQYLKCFGLQSLRGRTQIDLTVLKKLPPSRPSWPRAGNNKHIFELLCRQNFRS
jgi:hypothetical protein